MEDKTVPLGMLSKLYDNRVYMDLGKLIELAKIDEELSWKSFYPILW